MAANQENSGGTAARRRRFAFWLLPLLVGGLYLFTDSGPRDLPPEDADPSRQTVDPASQASNLPSPEPAAVGFFGPVSRLTPVVGDWNGDGRDETGVYHAYGGIGRFLLDDGGNDSPDPNLLAVLYGPSRVTPVAGDWNGDGRHQLGFYGSRGEIAEFVLDSNDNGSLDPGDRICNYGLATDTPIAGDWNGDGCDQVGTFRPIGDIGQFILDSNDNGVWDPTDGVFLYGLATDRPVVGDWDGDGRDDIGNFRAAGEIGQFILDSNGNGVWDPTDRVFSFGLASDIPIAGDWNGDGRDEIGNFRVDGDCALFILDSNNSGRWEATDLVRRYRPAVQKTNESQ